MISLEEHGKRFNYRAVAIMLHDGHVLVHRAEYENFWSLPGGRVEICESAAVTICREMQEELGVAVEVERLVWVMETFFEDRGKPCHELGLYFLVSLPPDSPLAQQHEPFFGDEDGLRLIFEWARLDQLATLPLPLHPVFLREALQTLPATIGHVVEYEPLLGSAQPPTSTS